MSDGAPRDAAVFGGLDAFDDHTVDPDAMDRMLLNLAAASDPPDWQLDALSPDFYTPSNVPYPSLPLHYIDTQPPTAVPSPAHPHSSIALPSPPAASAGPATACPHPASTAVTAPASNPPTSSPSSDINVQVSLDGRPTNITSRARQNSIQQTPTVKFSQPHHPQVSPAPVTTLQKRPAPTPAACRSPRPARSPTLSGSSAKPRIPTALCSLCGKSISTNGANFRRHEQACSRRERVSSARPPSSSAVSAPAAAASEVYHNAAASLRDSVGSPPSVPGQSLHPPGLNRRDSDLLSVVTRLETSIGTLDVSARLCLRDALLSLSNKASNPHVPPTPEQEAMNRAAEYLVLRMLFLSGQQVMHTAPGTTGTAYAPEDQAASSSEQGVASLSQQASRDIRTRDPDGGSGGGDDGTVAASTGTRGASVTKRECSDRHTLIRPTTKTENRIADGT